MMPQCCGTHLRRSSGAPNYIIATFTEQQKSIPGRQGRRLPAAVEFASITAFRMALEHNMNLRTRSQWLMTSICLLSLVAAANDASSQEPSFGPIIEDFGPTYPINDRDIPLKEGFVYRAVFDVASYTGEPTAMNSMLVSAARFLNMHARNGVPADAMKLAVVVHGSALKAVLTNDAYRSRYKIDNPNLELIERLHDAGVEFYVCGQSMTFGGVAKQELVQPAKVALSAMTMLTVLQSKNFALLP
jgi:intracellular sulfur oxidation DsrE/DsrF family protein